MTGAILRYAGEDALRGQRWAAPVVCFLAAIVLFDSGGGSALSCYSFGAVAMFPVALWLGVAVTNSEEPIQTLITVVTVDSSLRVRLAKLGVAYLLCLPLAVASLGWAMATGHRATPLSVVAGGAAMLLTALAGVAVSALLSRPLMSRVGWVVVLAAGVTLAEILVPGAPPVRQLISLFAGDNANRLAVPLALVAAETVGLAGLVLAFAHCVADHRV